MIITSPTEARKDFYQLLKMLIIITNQFILVVIMPKIML